jgi:hypothetical protein
MQANNYFALQDKCPTKVKRTFISFCWTFISFCRTTNKVKSYPQANGAPGVSLGRG